MEACVKLPARWPGFTARNTVVVEIDETALPPPKAPLLLAGRRFEPKAELHITVIGAALGARVIEALAAQRFDEADLVRAFEAPRSWSLKRTGRCVRLAKQTPDPAVAGKTFEAGSIIEMIELPAMATFHAELGKLLRTVLPVPPPHLTLYTYGDDAGIGVPDAATLAALTVARLELPR